MATQPERSRVFCLEESVWVESLSLTDQTSVLPTLEQLHRIGVLREFVHRHALSSTEFEDYLSWRRASKKLRNYGTVYLAFHGTRDGLRVGDKSVSLDLLAERLGDVSGGVVHLGSCAVLKGNDDAATRFLEKTGARLLSGYERDVTWLDSAASTLHGWATWQITRSSVTLLTIFATGTRRSSTLSSGTTSRRDTRAS